MPGTEVHDLDDANIKLLKMFDDLQMVVSLIRKVQKENMQLKQETECQRETGLGNSDRVHTPPQEASRQRRTADKQSPG